MNSVKSSWGCMILVLLRSSVRQHSNEAKIVKIHEDLIPFMDQFCHEKRDPIFHRPRKRKEKKGFNTLELYTLIPFLIYFFLDIA